MYTSLFSMAEVRDWIKSRETLLQDGAKAIVLQANSETLKGIGKDLDIGNNLKGVSQYLCWYCIITSPVGSCAHPLHCANSKFAQWNSRLQTVCPSCRLRNERRWKIMHYSD